MSWSYSGSPGSSQLDTVRFYLQDTDITDQLLQDEEITFVISSWINIYPDLYWAAAECAEVISAKFAREVAVAGDGVSVGIQELQNKYEQLAANLRQRHKDSAVAPNDDFFDAGTIFDNYFDPTIQPLSFGKRMHDNRRAGQQDFGGEIPGYDPYPNDLGIPQ